MPTYQQFRMPDVGEGLTEAEILQWYVAVGDTVTINQNIVEIETAKAAVELPCPFAGVVTELLADAGTTVPVGTPIITVDTDLTRDDGAAPPAAQDGPADPLQEPAGPNPSDRTIDASGERSGEPGPGSGGHPGDGGPEPVTRRLDEQTRQLAVTEFVPTPKPQREAVLVGYGVMSGSVTRRRRRPTGPPAAGPVPGRPPAPGGGQGADTWVADRTGRVRAKPPVRKLARDLGVDLAAVAPTGPEGTVTRADVEGFARAAGVAPPGPTGLVLTGVGPAVLHRPGERREQVKGVRKYMAEAMVRSAFTVPHVTEWVEVDITRSVKLVHRLRQTPGFDQARVSPLLLVARAVLLMLKVVPELNAVWDESGAEVVYKEHVNLGIAADTPRGLVVPNIKAADALSLPELARALRELAETARAGRTTPADMSDGTFTITNVGVFGVDGGTPIINPGESAILAVGAVRERPWVHKGKVRPRWVVQLAVSFDHRFIDGGTGARFLGGVAALLHDPAMPPVVR